MSMTKNGEKTIVSRLKQFERLKSDLYELIKDLEVQAEDFLEDLDSRTCPDALWADGVLSARADLIQLVEEHFEDRPRTKYNGGSGAALQRPAEEPPKPIGDIEPPDGWKHYDTEGLSEVTTPCRKFGNLTSTIVEFPVRFEDKDSLMEPTHGGLCQVDSKGYIVPATPYGAIGICQGVEFSYDSYRGSLHGTAKVLMY